VSLNNLELTLLRGPQASGRGMRCRNLEIDSVIAALEEAEKKPGVEVENWAERPLESLSSHIMAKHHAYVKGELPRLAQLAQKL